MHEIIIEHLAALNKTTKFEFEKIVELRAMLYGGGNYSMLDELYIIETKMKELNIEINNKLELAKALKNM